MGGLQCGGLFPQDKNGSRKGLEGSEPTLE